MKHVRRLLALLLALCMVFALAACDSSHRDDDDDDDDDEQEQEKIDLGELLDPGKEPAPAEEMKLTYYILATEAFDLESADDEIWDYGIEFDENGNLSHYLKIDREYTFTYDENGMLLQANRLENDGWMETIDYTWDENANLTMVVYKYADGDERYRYEYEYDEQNRMDKETFYDFAELDHWVIYEYTDVGYNEYRYNADGALYRRVETELDEYGNPTRVMAYTPEDVCDYVSDTAYVYTDDGVMVSATDTEDDGFVTNATCDEFGNVVYCETFRDGKPYSASTMTYQAVEMTERQYRAYLQIEETFGHY